MKQITIIAYIVVGILLAGCKADMICPAYQSYFLLDETAQKDHFSYFAQDSLPRRDVFHTSTNKNGLVAKTSLFAYIDQNWVRNREIRTVNMEVIYPKISDSLLFAGDVMMYAETDVVDSAALDSARMAAQTFQYNVDQKFYNWYLRDKLVWKDEINKGKKSNTDSNIEKKGFFGFLKNLFKKKEKSEKGNTVTAENTVLEEPTTEKGGLFKKKEKQPKETKPKKVKSKKQKKTNPTPEKKVVPTPKKEEDNGEDDF